MTNPASNDNGLIAARYHKYGYSVSVFLDRKNGIPDDYLECGNSPFESTFVITDIDDKNSGRLKLSALRKLAKSSAIELANEYGISNKSIFVDRDYEFDEEMQRIFQKNHW